MIFFLAAFGILHEWLSDIGFKLNAYMYTPAPSKEKK